MNAFPETDDGQPWFDIPDEIYFDWFADYLPTHLPELSIDQKQFYDSFDEVDPLTGFLIGDRAGWYESQGTMMPNFAFPSDFCEKPDFDAVKLLDGGFSYENYVDEQISADVLEPGERLMTCEEYILDDFAWYLILEEEKKQFSHYWPNFMKRDAFNIIFVMDTLHHEPPDAGWRVYLAMVLQNIDDKACRLKEIQDFYRYWHEIISK
jgi:hypothetical protein